MGEMVLKLISTFIGLTAITLAWAQDASGPVVKVNGQGVNGAEYHHRMAHLNGVYAAYGERLVEVAPGLVTLDRMITEIATLQLATAHSVAPTPAEIDAAYQSRLKSNPTLEKDAETQGLTVSDLKYQVSIDLARFKLLTEGVLVTDQEVQDNFKNNPGRYTTPKMVDVRVIVVDSDEAKSAVDAELAAGKEFGAVAKERSLDLSKVSGGVVPTAPVDSFPQAIKEALAAIKIGDTTQWLPVPGQAAGSPLTEKIQYVKATPPAPLPFDANLKEAIRRQMMMERGSVKNNVAKELSDMLASAKVEITDPVFAKAWQELRDKVKAAKGKQAG
jgi:hypothetical protein